MSGLGGLATAVAVGAVAVAAGAAAVLVWFIELRGEMPSSGALPDNPAAVVVATERAKDVRSLPTQLPSSSSSRSKSESKMQRRSNARITSGEGKQVFKWACARHCKFQGRSRIQLQGSSA